MKTLIFCRKLFVAIWVGKIVFFASSIAPTVFQVLERNDAALLQAKIFPKYFGLGLITTLGVLIISLFLWFSKHRSKFLKPVIIISIVAVGTYAYLLYGLTPQILHLQPEVLALPKGSTELAALEFAKIHSLSTSLNLIVLILGLVCLAML